MRGLLMRGEVAKCDKPQLRRYDYDDDDDDGMVMV